MQKSRDWAERARVLEQRSCFGPCLETTNGVSVNIEYTPID